MVLIFEQDIFKQPTYFLTSFSKEKLSNFFKKTRYQI